jgi:hypothetical protein
VSKYMIGRRGPPSQSWRTFLRNHADAIAAVDLCVVPTLTFERLFAFFSQVPTRTLNLRQMRSTFPHQHIFLATYRVGRGSLPASRPRCDRCMF